MRITTKRYLITIFISLASLVFLFVFLKLFITNGIALLNHDPRAMDFLAFYTGAALLYQHPADLYNLSSQMLLQQQIVPDTKALHIFLPFLNPPFVALFFYRLPICRFYSVMPFRSCSMCFVSLSSICSR